MRAARRQGVLGVVRCGTGPLSRVRARAPRVQHLLRGGYKRDLHAFQGGQRHHGRFGAPEGEKGGEGKQLPETRSSRFRSGACLTLMMSGSSRNRPRKMMRVIVVVCAAFGLTTSEAKTEIMSLRVKGMPESTAIFSVEAAAQVGNKRTSLTHGVAS